ncbi:hypothetical protein KJ969_02190 [Patescibacteria group bacterium]|nr:hypothetical protein [Patescibacteria group bacterium]MBU1922344.1 hypothetical protein [Patescibacteria group bacterium]
MNKTILTIIIILAVLALVGAAGSYYLFLNMKDNQARLAENFQALDDRISGLESGAGDEASEESEEETSEVSEELETLVSFASADYGFVFNYPRGWGEPSARLTDFDQGSQVPEVRGKYLEISFPPKDCGAADCGPELTSLDFRVRTKELFVGDHGGVEYALGYSGKTETMPEDLIKKIMGNEALDVGYLLETMTTPNGYVTRFESQLMSEGGEQWLRTTYVLPLAEVEAFDAAVITISWYGYEVARFGHSPTEDENLALAQEIEDNKAEATAQAVLNNVETILKSFTNL